MIQLPPEFKEFLRLLNAHGVDYLLIGGYAVNFYGYNRYTGDIDFWIKISPENARRMTAAIREFGFDVPGLDEAAFLDRDNIVRFGYPPMRIEIVMSISGVGFEECAARKREAFMDGVPVRLISVPDLIKNKQAAGRFKDLADAEKLGEPGEV